MCWHCYFCSQNKIAGKITCKRQGEVRPRRFKPRCWLSRLGALHWGGRGHPSGVGVVSSWVTADRGLFLAPPRAGWGAWGSLRVSSLNQKEQQSLLRSALRCELEMDEDLIMHPRQPSPPRQPTPSAAFGSRHSGQHISHPKICFALLPWHAEPGGVCVAPRTAGGPPWALVQTPIQEGVRVCV